MPSLRVAWFRTTRRRTMAMRSFACSFGLCGKWVRSMNKLNETSARYTFKFQPTKFSRFFMENYSFSSRKILFRKKVIKMCSTNRKWGIELIFRNWLCGRWCGLGRCSLYRHSTHTIERHSMIPRSSRTRTPSNRTGTVRGCEAMLANTDRLSLFFQYVFAFISFSLIAFNGNYRRIRKVYFEEKSEKPKIFPWKNIRKTLNRYICNARKLFNKSEISLLNAKIDIYFDWISTEKATNCNGFRNVVQKWRKSQSKCEYIFNDNLNMLNMNLFSISETVVGMGRKFGKPSLQKYS